MSLNFHTAIIAASRRAVAPPPSGFDAAAQDWFDRIVAAGSTISEANKTAVNAFIVGCKDDLIWSAIKASCILAGADTLAGALVPLVGSAPTNVGGLLLPEHYSRTAGLDFASPRWLDSNRANNADPQGSNHNAVYFTIAPPTGYFMGTADSLGTAGANNFATDASGVVRMRVNGGAVSGLGVAVNNSTFAASRYDENNITRRISGVTTSYAVVSAPPTAGTIRVGQANNRYPASCTISFYSIGESLDPAQLDARLTTLMGALT